MTLTGIADTLFRAMSGAEHIKYCAFDKFGNLGKDGATGRGVCKTKVSEIERQLDYGCHHEPPSGQQERRQTRPIPRTKPIKSNIPTQPARNTPPGGVPYRGLAIPCGSLTI